MLFRSAPPSPSLTAKHMRGPSVPPAPLELKLSRPGTEPEPSKVMRDEKTPDKATRGLVVQDSLTSVMSVTSEAPTEIHGSDAGTLVDGHTETSKSTKADSDQIPMDTDEDTLPKSPTTPTPSPSKRRAKPSRSNQQVLTASPDIGSTSPRRARAGRRQRTADQDGVDNASNEVDGEGSRPKRRRS